MTQQIAPATYARIACIAIIAAAGLAACAPLYDNPEQVDSDPPSVSYDYSTEDGLLEASAEARSYCGQYASTPAIQGSIIRNPDGSNRVTFECVRTGAVAMSQTIQPYPAPPAPPRGYLYSSDTQLLAAIQSADAYCYQTGQVASTQIVTNRDGTKTLNFNCVPG